MPPFFRRVISGIALIALPAIALTGIVPSAAFADEPHPGVRLRSSLNGNQMEDQVMDPDGMGMLTAWIDTSTGQICHRLSVRRIGAVTAIELHRGRVGLEGPEIMTMPLPAANGISEGCAAIAADASAPLLARPSDYYVLVRTDAFAGGAVRGQLGR